MITRPVPGQWIAGAGGALMIVTLFLPWADAGDGNQNGWEFWTMVDVFFVIVGLVAIAAALTGGRYGLFRTDLSLNGATDLLGVVSTLLLGWLVLFDFPAGASPELGVYLALGAAAVIMVGAGDYGSLRGEPAFPRLRGDEAEPVARRP
jgi:hypothetical protein